MTGEIILVSFLTTVLAASACNFVGNFLVLRKLSLLGDAISHAVLPGIVVAFLIVGSLESPMFFICSVLFAMILSGSIQWFSDRMKVSHESVIGIVFTSLFALGVVMLVRYAGNVHLDQDAVLFGQVEFSAFNRLEVFGVDVGARSLWMMGVVMFLDLLCLSLFWKEMKLSAFDARFSDSVGISSKKMHYLLVFLVAITVVAAFEAVGVVLVVALLVVPSVTAYILVSSFGRMVLFGQVFAFLSSVFGYLFAFKFDVSIAGSVALMAGLVLFAAVCGSLILKKLCYNSGRCSN